MGQPTVYVIAGPNGAGKTTFATQFLPEFVHCREFLNADLIAAGLAPFAPETQNIRAGRLLLQRIAELTDKREDFGFETTLSGRSYVRMFRKMRVGGYRIQLFFLWLPSADIAVSRVANRVRQGGHNIPEADIRRRYIAGQRNFFRLYQDIIDGWHLYDATKPRPLLIAQRENARLKLIDAETFKTIESEYSRCMMIERSKTSDLTQLAEAAFEQAARKVVERAKQTGTPVIVWEDGQVKELPPEHFDYLMDEADGSPSDQK